MKYVLIQMPDSAIDIVDNHDSIGKSWAENMRDRQEPPEPLADFWNMSAAQHLGASCPYCNAVMDEYDVCQTDKKDDSHE